jgi:O-antigen/teichoic acid export membrane protein
LLLLPICAALGIFAHDILLLWIDAEFADNSAFLLQVFALGVLVNSTAHIPFTLIQSAGHPKWTAMIHLVEVIPFLLVLWWATTHFGLVGAVLAWLLRILLDTVAMFLVSARVLRLGTRAIVPSQPLLLLALTAFAVALAFLDSLVLRAAGVLAISALAGLLVLREPAVAARLKKLRAQPAG